MTARLKLSNQIVGKLMVFASSVGAGASLWIAFRGSCEEDCAGILVLFLISAATGATGFLQVLSANLHDQRSIGGAASEALRSHFTKSAIIAHAVAFGILLFPLSLLFVGCLVIAGFIHLGLQSTLSNRTKIRSSKDATAPWNGLPLLSCVVYFLSAVMLMLTARAVVSLITGASSWYLSLIPSVLALGCVNATWSLRSYVASQL